MRIDCKPRKCGSFVLCVRFFFFCSRKLDQGVSVNVFMNVSFVCWFSLVDSFNLKDW